MSLEAQMTKTASIQQPGTPTRSSTGEVTAVWATAVDVICSLHPGIPGSIRDMFGDLLDVTATIYLPAGTDIRPDHADSNGQGSKVTIDSVVYTCVGVLDTATKSKFLIAALRRMG